MISALKGVKDIDQVRFGVRNGRSDLNAAELPWIHPYVTYRFRFPDGHTSEVWLDAYRGFGLDGDIYYFMAVVSGLATPGSPPPDFGIPRVSKIWKAKCGISASAFSM